MDRTYENDKTLALSKAYGFCIAVPPKKNYKSPWLCDKQLYKQRNITERYFLRLKHFKKFLVFMTNLIIFLFSLYIFFLFSIHFLCEHCLAFYIVFLLVSFSFIPLFYLFFLISQLYFYFM